MNLLVHQSLSCAAVLMIALSFSANENALAFNGGTPSDSRLAPNSDAALSKLSRKTKKTSKTDILSEKVRIEKFLVDSYKDSELTALDSEQESFSNPRCSAHLNPFWDQDTVRIYFGIGYGDFSPNPFVDDLLEAEVLAKTLASPCLVKNYFFCGFQITSKDSSLIKLEKIYSDSDSDSQDRKVEVVIASSSVSYDNRKNQNNDSQLLKSEWATRMFENSFEEFDIVIYFGHNREHFGPDFHPPLLGDGNHVEYELYGTENPNSGYQLISRGLRSVNRRAKFVAALGCITKPTLQPLFSDFKDVNFITSHLTIESDDQIEESIRLVEGLYWNDCRATSYTYDGETTKGKILPTFSTTGPFFQQMK